MVPNSQDKNSRDKDLQPEDAVFHNRALATPHIGRLPHCVDELSKVSMSVGHG
jgi:hypothetical protein